MAPARACRRQRSTALRDVRAEQQPTFGLGGGVSRSAAEGIPSFEHATDRSTGPEGVPSHDPIPLCRPEPRVRRRARHDRRDRPGPPGTRIPAARIRLPRRDGRCPSARPASCPTTTPTCGPPTCAASSPAPRRRWTRRSCWSRAIAYRRAPGLYEMDELRRVERSIASLLDRYAQPGSSRQAPMTSSCCAMSRLRSVRTAPLIQPAPGRRRRHGRAVDPAGRDGRRAAPGRLPRARTRRRASPPPARRVGDRRGDPRHAGRTGRSATAESSRPGA